MSPSRKSSSADGRRGSWPTELDAVGAEPVARDLVDDDGVEVVHHRVAVAVERIRGDRRKRRRDLGERGLHARVERRAPERVPVAVAVVEIRVDEALRERAVRELDDREDALGAAAELEVGRGGSSAERDELADVDAPRRNAAGERQVGRRRRPGIELPVA